MPAAFVMSATCALLRGVATASGSSSPGEVLARVNEALLARIPANMFVTCFYAILDPKSGSLSHANAGHNLWTIVFPAALVIAFAGCLWAFAVLLGTSSKRGYVDGCA